MAATIVRIDPAAVNREREQRLLELVRDLSGAPSRAAAVAFQQAPPAPAEPLERVAHALVRLRHSGGLRVAGYVPPARRAPGRSADIVPFPTLRAGPGWPERVRAQLICSRNATSTED